MSQNRFYRITIFIFSLLFLNIIILQAGIHAPKGEEDKIKLRIKGKERAYYELDKNGLKYNGVGEKCKMNEGIWCGDEIFEN